MFHRALPELNGFGVITFTPGLIRSDQFLDVVGVSLSHHEHDNRVGDEAVVRPDGVPAR